MPKIQYNQDGYPIYDKNAGWKDYSQFEAAALNEMNQFSKPTKQTNSQPSTGGNLIKTAGRIASASLPAVGSAVGLGAADLLAPEAGIPATLASIAGAGGGSIIKQALQEKFPGLFGNAPQNLVGKSADVLTDAALQGAIPGVAASGMAIPLKGAAGRIAGNLLGSRTISILPKASPKIIDLLHVLGTLPRIQNDSSVGGK